MLSAWAFPTSTGSRQWTPLHSAMGVCPCCLTTHGPLEDLTECICGTTLDVEPFYSPFAGDVDYEIEETTTTWDESEFTAPTTGRRRRRNRRPRGKPVFIDIGEDQEKYILSADVAGVKKEDLKLNIDRDILTISGEKKRDQNLQYSRRERDAGKVKRSLRIPANADVDPSRISAKFENGVLIVTLPKKEPKKLEASKKKKDQDVEMEMEKEKTPAQKEPQAPAVQTQAGQEKQKESQVSTQTQPEKSKESQEPLQPEKPHQSLLVQTPSQTQSGQKEHETSVPMQAQKGEKEKAKAQTGQKEKEKEKASIPIG